METIYETFNRYPWDTDNVFQAGLDTILESLPRDSEDDLVEQARLLKAKHFYFTRFQQDFDLENYLKYEQEKLNEKKNQQQFERLEKYDYDHDQDYTNGLPNIIRGWLQSQSVNGLWDKEKLDLEFSKAKAFYYVARVEKVDLNAYFSWKLKKEQENKPACPFANRWLNKKKLGPVKQTNGQSFVVTEKRQGPETITFSSPKSKNVLSVARLQEIRGALKEAESDSTVTSIFITTTVADTSNPFEINERIETKDTKLMSSGLAYDETSQLAVSSDSQRQVSLDNLATIYYDLIHAILSRKDPKLIVTFSNGQIPLNAVYLTLCLGFMRVITEHSLLVLTLKLSHAPIPPLLLLAMARARTTNPLPAGIDLYLALSAPEYAKLRGPEIMRLGLADAFVPEVKLADAFETAKNMAICPAPDTNTSVQLALAIHHTYSGPNRLSVWEKQIEATFGAASSFEDLKERLELQNTTWSQTILKHWKTLPPTLLKVIFQAVKQCEHLNPLEILELEKKLNQKWRQTKEYQQWLEGEKEQAWVDTSVDFYFEEEEVENNNSLEKPVVFEAHQEVEEEEAMVCPVTGQKSAAGCPVKAATTQQEESKCPVTGQVSSTGAATCPVSGQSKEEVQGKCPVSGSQSSEAQGKCPVSGQSNDVQGKCPVSGQTSSNATAQDISGKCPVSGQQSTSTTTTEGCPFSKVNNITPAMENLTL